MLLECIFVLENKSLTNVGEFWEVESRMTIGDENYAHLQTFLRTFPLGIVGKSTGEEELWSLDL